MQNQYFKLGDYKLHRLGFEAMRITGKGVWGKPADLAESIATLKRVPELGINFIDTADSYGPDVSEVLIRKALHPYKDLEENTKAADITLAPRDFDRLSSIQST
ncbi:aldo/keto reductase [Methylobacillus sp. Pita1]|uniref:aldo/keto reductase n=1 Tax=Methylobacillus sp. Pita1 TaxID=3382642 RepID=UPI0038B56B82